MAKTKASTNKTSGKKSKATDKATKTDQLDQEPAWLLTDAANTRFEAVPRSGRPVEIEDLYAWALPGNVQASPDGTRVVASLLTIDKDSDDYRSALVEIPLDGSEPHHLTSGRYSDTSPKWSPDGSRIAFLSNRDDKKPHLFVLPVNGGESRQITHGDDGVNDFDWSPDGAKIVYTSAVDPHADDDDDDEKSDVKVITSARYKFDGMGFLGDKVSQLFIVDVDQDDAEPMQLTDDAFHCSSPAWSPGGSDIAFTSNRDPDWDVSRTNDIWLIKVNGGTLRKLTNGKGHWGSPAWSPDGTTIVVTGDDDVAKLRVNANLYTVRVGSGGVTRIGETIDRTISDASMSGPNGAPGQTVRWTADGGAIDALVADRGSTSVVRFPLDGGKPTRRTPAGLHVNAFAQIAGDDLVVTATGPTSPAEVYRVTAKEVTRLTSFNEAWAAKVGIPAPEPFSFASNGYEIQGWLLRPAGNSRTSKALAPLILNIHGGPAAQFSNAWFHELQMYAARGFALAFINPRGSTGRTNAFAREVTAAWGTADMPDFMGAIDHVIGMGGIDPGRIGVTGGSYGGFSTNWLIGHSDRFKAAVTDRSICNMASMYGTDDIALVSLDAEMGAPWENPDLYWDMSPLKYVANVETPLLIVHSENDYRCPMEQAEQFYTALKRCGKIVEFIRFPNESHGLSRGGKPKHRVERLQRTLGWFETYL